ncbi:hypothetical protein L53_06860 [Hyphomonas sp. L-53-1-40]|uniref:hypothetical protein n=1 Tax=Hyphomonas sp. L-53-1-40 TaxID=1207058 RepID=UPI000458D235|nr:hypothetical protein [Hyphomonas sp. L-53-1-40]KCZ64217.1 hypothetical protein L53_06860 [Hyphomonas sp. L-53-1-40]
MTKLTWYVTRVHRLLALVVGAQLLIWTVSGFFFTLKPIEQVRGTHLRADMTLDPTSIPSGLTPPVGLQGAPILSADLKRLGDGYVWEVTDTSGTRLYDTVTGAARASLAEADIRAAATAHWAGRGRLETVALVDAAPAETGRAGQPLWRAEFTGQDTATFWIDPQTADLVAVRTPWWRAFDLLWGLHIMDWTSRETFTTWWMKLFGFGAVTLSLAGIWLLVDRARKGRLFR